MRYLICFLFIMLLGTQIALAASMGGGLPWETPLSTIKDSLTGPVAGAISLVAIVVAGAVLIFGGDFSAFVRALINVVLVISILIGSSSLLSHLFGVSGAVIRREHLRSFSQPGGR
jgi:type IV secretion system protein VirB2